MGSPATPQWGCIIICMIWTTHGFFPDHTNKYVPDTDFTLTDLTMNTVVRVAAIYFEDSDPDRYVPGNLTGLDPLTPSTLFAAHYGTCVSSASFQSAIDEILGKNLLVANNYVNKSKWHFNADTINQGNSHMVAIRSSILSILDKSSPDYSSARSKIGEFLHLLHSFYSNTNWIELNQRNNDISHNREIGIKDVLSHIQAPTTELSCFNCDGPKNLTSPRDQDCRNNYDPLKLFLFSGYHNDQDIKKPETYDIDGIRGKCSHGGKLDPGWHTVAIGGINKATSDPDISPHHDLHTTAAELAIEGGIAFFNDKEYGLYNIINETKFRQLLNLDVGKSLPMVIDTTGSMEEEIDGVIAATVALVNEHRDTCFAPTNYVVSPFNDPETGPLIDTTDPDECIAKLHALEAYGGGDCPELMFTALEAALHKITTNSYIYIYTDADAKDSHEKLVPVVALMKKLNTIPKMIFTPGCSFASRNRRSPETKSVSAYETLIDETGGSMYHATDDNIDEVARVMQADLRASQVSVLKWSHDSFTNATIVIPVDGTIEELSVSVSTDGSTPSSHTQIFDPFGTGLLWTHPSIDIMIDTSGEFLFILDADVSGNWMLQINRDMTATLVNVEVSARSLVDFSYKIMTESTFGSLVPIEGAPIAGSNVTLQIHAVSPELLNSIDSVNIKDEDGRTVLLNSSLVEVGGITPGYYTSDITLPQQRFTVSMEGRDINGHKVLRLQPAKVDVVDFGLSILQDNNTLDNLAPGGEEHFLFLVSNGGGYDTFDISLSIANQGSLNETVVTGTVTPTRMVLYAGESAEGTVLLSTETAASVGDSVLVTLGVISRSTSQRSAISMSVTLIEPLPATTPEPDDAAAPTCNILETTGYCTIDMINNDCQNHTWSARFLFLDDLALVEIDVSNDGLSGTGYSLEYVHPRNTTLRYQSDCCCPYVNVSISDIVGNNDWCEVDYYTPIQDSISIDVCYDAIPPPSSQSPATTSITTKNVSKPPSSESPATTSITTKDVSKRTKISSPVLTTILKTRASDSTITRPANTRILTPKNVTTKYETTTSPLTTRSTTGYAKNPNSEELSKGAKIAIGSAATVLFVLLVAVLVYMLVNPISTKISPTEVHIVHESDA